MPWRALLQYLQHIHSGGESAHFCEVYRLLHLFLALPFGGCRSTVPEWVLPVPVCEGVSVGETMGTCRCFYKVWVLQLHGYSQLHS